MNSQNRPHDIPSDEQLDLGLRAIAAAEARDIQLASQMSDTADEDAALDGFTQQLTPKKRRSPLVLIVGAAAALAASVVIFNTLGNETSPSVTVSPGDGPALGHGASTDSAQVSLERRDDGQIWLDLHIDLPIDYSLDLKFRTPDGSIFASVTDVNLLPWRYDTKLFGSFPEKYSLEIITWEDGIDTLESFAEPLFLGPFSSDLSLDSSSNL